MKLMLNIISDSGQVLDTVSLAQSSVTIGRAKDNDIVLEDDKRVISHHHAVIDFHDPDYFLTDISTNGVLVNDAVQPLGKGNRIRLNDDDKLYIGDYTVVVNFSQKAEVADGIDVTSGPLSDEEKYVLDDDPFADLGQDSVQKMIDENQLTPGNWQKADKTKDDFFEFDIPGQNDREEDLTPPVEMNRISAVKEAFEPFQGNQKEDEKISSDIFEEDWFSKTNKNQQSVDKDPFDLDFFEQESESSKVQEFEPAPVVKKESEPEAKISFGKIEPVAIHDSADSSSKQEAVTATEDFEQAVAYFLKGIGVKSSHLQQNLNPETFYIVGKILRASVQGTIDVLIGRAKIKNEMHLDVTMIRSRQNNPIKFSVSAEEAIKKLLAPEDEGYLSAEEAIDEVFDDIRAHQFSMIAGMQAALLEVLKRFDPDKLEHRLQQESPISASIPIHKQAKLWRLFQHLYEEIEHEASDDFYHLFGQVFAETYQDQINHLRKR